MTREEKLKKATEFNKGWTRECRGFYTHARGWFISKHRGFWKVSRHLGAINPMPGSHNFQTLDDAKRAVNQYVFDKNLYVSTGAE